MLSTSRMLIYAPKLPAVECSRQSVTIIVLVACSTPIRYILTIGSILNYYTRRGDMRRQKSRFISVLLVVFLLNASREGTQACLLVVLAWCKPILSATSGVVSSTRRGDAAKEIHKRSSVSIKCIAPHLRTRCVWSVVIS
jgi:hypothetical protein